jgi:branched-chain amino acid aminotransferase
VTGPSDITPVVWIDGERRDPATAGLHWSDHGITVGDGVFETLKLTGGEPFALRRHLDRLTRSAEGLRLPLPPRDGIEAAVAEVAATWGGRLGRLRITVTAGRGPMGSPRGVEGPTLMVTAGELSLSREPTDVLVVPMTRNERGALAGLKTTSYAENVLALALAEEAGASEAIFANTRGELCEGTGANVVIGLAGELRTPPLDSGCLAGVTRALLLEAMAAAGGPIIEEALPLNRLREADEAFLLSTGREVQPIRAVDGRALTQAPGPLTGAAMAVWDAAYGAAAGAIDP